MSYVIVDLNTKCSVMNYNTRVDRYATERSAKASLTRHVNREKADRSKFVVMEYTAYRAQVPMVTRKNLMTGVEFQTSADTPIYCCPSSESYWSM